ncbi:MAG: YifB family Mg chelatase-like AAA ATPase [Thiomargarita sp.]|nr:YifB family Mg chelatase-like AAA ATPase [Thiomargarita sp.]
MSSLAIVHSRAQVGIQALPVTIEVHLTNGLPRLSIVGLPETAVRESQDRVRSAIINSQFEFPLQRITINLAPADLPKEGGRFDLAIALGILAASRQIPKEELSQYEFLGELALNGNLRPVRGILPMALEARKAQRYVVVPIENASEAAMVSGVSILPIKTLLDICSHLQQVDSITPYCSEETPNPTVLNHISDLSDVRGQHHAKRALEVAAAGGHNLLMLGPPGTGKTMLASRMPGILPPMTEDESLATATIASIAVGGFDASIWGIRPFRTPHHTASGVALVGGGSHPRPGEISLAHNGILFLDELPEFDKRVLEVLREPLESGRITISRAAQQAEFPANFQLIAAMNPCPCGYLGDPSNRCQCSPHQVARYRSRISGPLLDRIDLHIEVPNLPRIELRKDTVRTSSAEVRVRVIMAREKQLERTNKANNLLSNQEIERVCVLNENDEQLLDSAIERLGLSARAWYRILKVARTIADLDDSEAIQTSHLTEAITYRQLERNKH